MLFLRTKFSSVILRDGVSLKAVRVVPVKNCPGRKNYVISRMVKNWYGSKVPYLKDKKVGIPRNGDRAVVTASTGQ